MRRRLAPSGAVEIREAGGSSTGFYYAWLLLALFLEYARPTSHVPGLNIPFLYSGVPFLLLLASSFAAGLRPVKDVFADSSAKWVVIFLALIMLSVTHADVTLFAFDISKAVLGYVFLFIMIARIVTTHERLMGVVVTLLLAHLFLLAMNPQVVITPDRTHYITGGTFLGDGNDFALSICILFPLVIEVAIRARRKIFRWLLWVATAMLVLAVVATQSRGGTLGMGATIILLVMRSSRKTLALTGLAVIGVVVAAYAPPAYFQRIGTISKYEADGSAQGRIEAWKSSLHMAADNPLLGVGAGHFAVANGTKYRSALAKAENWPWLTAHSSYFLVLGELGLPGLICILFLVFGNMLSNLRLRRVVLARAGPTPSSQALDDARTLDLMTAAMLGFGIAGAFLSAAYYPHIFVLTGLMVAVRRRLSAQIEVSRTSGDGGSVRTSRHRGSLKNREIGSVRKTASSRSLRRVTHRD